MQGTQTQNGFRDDGYLFSHLTQHGEIEIVSDHFDMRGGFTVIAPKIASSKEIFGAILVACQRHADVIKSIGVAGPVRYDHLVKRLVLI